MSLRGVGKHEFVALFDGVAVLKDFAGHHLILTLRFAKPLRHIRPADDPSLWIVLFQVELATHPTVDHRFRDRALLWANSEVDMHHYQRDQSYSRQSVQHVDHAPGHIAEEIWVAGKENRAHAEHHEDAGCNRA